VSVTGAQQVRFGAFWGRFGGFLRPEMDEMDDFGYNGWGFEAQNCRNRGEFDRFFLNFVLFFFFFFFI
jgi:hypothetical protein